MFKSIHKGNLIILLSPIMNYVAGINVSTFPIQCSVNFLEYCKLILGNRELLGT